MILRTNPLTIRVMTRLMIRATAPPDRRAENSADRRTANHTERPARGTGWRAWKWTGAGLQPRPD